MKKADTMRTFEFSKLLYKKMAEKGYGGKEITVHIPGMGSATIEDVIWHESCNEFHITLKVRERTNGE